VPRSFQNSAKEGLSGASTRDHVYAYVGLHSASAVVRLNVAGKYIGSPLCWPVRMCARVRDGTNVHVAGQAER
jgi:hypothetical protein